MPLRQIQDTYTLSEMVMIGWRNTETSVMLERQQRMPVANKSNTEDDGAFSDKERMFDRAITSFKTKLINKQGDVDMRKLTGPEACAYMSAIGIPLIPMFPVAKQPIQVNKDR